MVRSNLAFATTLLLTIGAQTARADDFDAQCRMGQGNDAPHCACLATKVKPADRAAAIAGMKTLNHAQSTGKPIDPTTLPPDQARNIQIVFQAMAQCP